MSNQEQNSSNNLNKLTLVYRQIVPKLTRYLTFRMKNHADSEEVAQEVYLRLMRIKDVDLVRNPSAYLFKIANNLVSEILLKQSKAPATIDLAEAIEHGLDEDTNTLARQIESDAAIKRLEKLLEELPPLYRSVLLLRKRDGYSHKEIANKLSISPNTVHIYLTRALLFCRSNWSE